MNAFKRISTLTGWAVFAIAAIVYFFSVERTGSLWDCGEFILGAYKLQVVHPPGAPLFILIGRMFTWIAELLSNDPADIAFAVNLMSGICTAFAAAFVAWITINLGKMALVGRDQAPDQAQNIALAASGLVGGLTTAFATSIWFSAVEGEVYAMSTFFTTLVVWATVKWYIHPDDPKQDRWLVFAIFMAGLSMGVHLLSILTFPALAIFYYLKKYKDHTLLGMGIAAAVGVGVIGFIQSVVIVGIPKLWSAFELFTVNTLGLGLHSGLIPTILLIAAVFFFALRFAHRRNNGLLQRIIVSAMLIVIAFTAYGVVVIRANVSTPVNMNNPDNAMRLIPYLNREQYGERALLRGPQFDVDRPVSYDFKDRYDWTGDRYEVVTQKITPEYADNDKVLFPRMGDPTQGRPSLYKMWMGLDPQKPLPPGRPNMGDNLTFFWKYQFNWMYWRYFFWNFAGRQNGDQGYYPWDKSAGHWISGIPFIDEAKLGNQSELPQNWKQAEGRNTYYMLPFLFGLLGLFFHAKKRKNDFVALLGLFVITGIGIIIYSNQPPNEPRERDYVLAGSIFTYSIWVGMGVLALFNILRERAKMSGMVAAVLAGALTFSAPLIMVAENFDDHSRRLNTGARDYAVNFLESCAENAVVFTYGDNDTYPLWYAQEVEGIRTDVRVINLSLIAVDWYIDLLRRRINDSPALNLTISQEGYRGRKRNQVMWPGQARVPQATLDQFMQFLSEKHELPLQGGQKTETYMPTQNVFIPVDKQEVYNAGVLTQADSAKIVDRIPLNLSGKHYLTKDEVAILDIISSNIWERPIYFAVTIRPEKMMGLQDYTQLEGMALRLIPVRSNSVGNLGVIGSGRVAPDIVYENVMNDFRWGNFDKYDLFVDESYGPSVQSLYLLMRRTADAFLQRGDTQKAIDLADKYFEAFPAMNFEYDYQTFAMIDIYVRAEAYDKAKPHMRLLADHLVDRLEFYDSLSPNILSSSYSDSQQRDMYAVRALTQATTEMGDTELQERFQALFAPYMPQQNQGQQPQQLLRD